MSARLLAAALLIATWQGSALADFAEGSAAYDGGDYRGALEIWLELAEEGDVAAQLAVADLYSTGTGVAANPAEAARWYRAAAQRGDPIAQLNLGDLYSRGQGMKRDLVQAYLWLSLAAAQGRRWPERRLSEISAEMSADELRKAKQLVREQVGP